MWFFKKKEKVQEGLGRDIDWGHKEKDLFGSSKTKNEEFDKNGYLVVRNIWDPKDLQEKLTMKLDIFYTITLENLIM